MPVFFYIDPAILDNPSTEDVHSITLSYTFFKTGDERGIAIPVTNNSNTDTTSSTVGASLKSKQKIKKNDSNAVEKVYLHAM